MQFGRFFGRTNIEHSLANRVVNTKMVAFSPSDESIFLLGTIYFFGLS
jgi:hypothetical protein